MLTKDTLFYLLCLFLSSCAMGPKMLSYTPAEYNKSAQQTQNEQMLMNLVRSKYLEQPFFLQIGSISTSYNYSGSAGGSITVPRNELPTVGVIQSLTGTLQGSYQELPTFTFAPLQGQQYFEYLLRNIELTQLGLLENWHFGFIMNTLVDRLGNTYNDPHDSNETYKNFLELAETLARLRQHKAADLLKSPGKELLRLRFQDGKEAERVETLLGVSKKIKVQEGQPLVGIYRLVPADDFVTETEDEAGRPLIPIKLRSFLDVLALLGQGVEVPDEDLARGVVLASQTPPIRSTNFRMIRVRQDLGKPDNAYVAVAYRGRWFYIEDSDILSKQVFSFLNLLFSLQSQSVVGQQPTLTIPVR